MHVPQRCSNAVSKACGVGLVTGLLAGDVEEDLVFASDHVADAVSIVSNWTKAASRVDALGMLWVLEVPSRRLLLRLLAC